MNFISKIVITEDFEKLQEELIEKFKNLRFIPKKPSLEFLLEDARAVEKESYIAENTEKIIVIMAYSFRIEAQNFLLKLLEEPPRNIKFLLACPSKNLLLSTIRSRLICENIKTKKIRPNLELNLKQLDLKEIFEFLQKYENLDKQNLLELIASLALKASEEKQLTQKDLQDFYQAYELANLNTRSNILFSNLLLNLYIKD